MSELASAVRTALAGVIDPEIHRPITELGMVDSVIAHPDGRVDVRVLLTIAGCPLQSTIEADVNAAVLGVEGVTAAHLDSRTMGAKVLHTRAKAACRARRRSFCSGVVLSRIRSRVRMGAAIVQQVLYEL